MSKKKAINFTVFVLMLGCLALLFTGCGKDDRSKQVMVFNYGEYLDMGLIQQFEKETGYEVLYEEFQTNEDMYSKFSANTASYDVICCSDYMIQKLLNEGHLLPIDFDQMQYESNIGKDFWDFSEAFDPGNKYSVPYFCGTVGILYDKTSVDPEIVKSWEALWDKDYSERIIMSNSIRDCFLPALKLKGYSLNTSSESELREAQQMLIDQKPIVQAYLVDETRDEMIAGNADMAMVFSSEAYYAFEYNDKLAYYVPDEGSNFWIDSWVIPDSCQNKDGAQEFIDFLCREDVAMTNFMFALTETPNQAVIDQLDSEFRNNEALFTPKEVMDRCEAYISLDDSTYDLYSRLWKEIKSAN